MMHRREWLHSAVGSGIAAALARVLGGATAALGELRSEEAAAEPLRLPPDLVGPLVATPASGSIWPGQPATLLTFGGVYPSPTLRVRSGDVVELRLENRLAEGTNVHWHGIAAPADADGYPTDLTRPGGVRDYRFQITDRAGTYWYHPHPDGRTAAQVYGGMAGFLIVEDDAERALGLPAGEQDVALLLQDRRLRADGSFRYAPTPMDLMSGYLGDVALVNGTPDAELSVAATQYRFRLLNGSNARVFRVSFDDARAFQIIGGDGGLLDRAMPATQFFLAPGERAEILVDFSRDPIGRSLRLVSLPFASRGTMGPGMGMGMGPGSAQGAPFSLLRLTVARPGRVGPTPTALVPLQRLDPARAEMRRRFVMQMGMPPFAGNQTINGLSFEPSRIDVRAERGVLESWDVVNASNEPHPFHVHATQFQVVSRSSGPLGPHELGWKDTVLVWPGEAVELLVRFERLAGLYVLHCHNLEHEDAGMMLNLEVR
jgi:FtsP/CotA-like multicopper oxidase with cupredoxin domain